jgi:hypothetical protein
VGPLRYVRYDDTLDVPNVVVDGSPNPSTVLVLSHWPGMATPPGVEADLSAQIAFRYLDAGADQHGDAEVVSNNHFDQDGLVSIYALTAPEAALAHRALLEDVAAAGDFATYRDRTAARISMTLAALRAGAGESDPYPSALEQLPAMVDDIERFRDRWDAEDAALTASEQAVATGRITIVEEPDLDLAVVTIGEGDDLGGGHRFAHQRYEGVHPMALHNATGCFRLAVVRGRRYELLFRYESWVQYRSRRPLPRVDLAPLAAALGEAEPGGGWEADDPSWLTPALRLAGGRESALTAGQFLDRVRAHLRTAPPAWDPYAAA